MIHKEQRGYERFGERAVWAVVPFALTLVIACHNSNQVAEQPFDESAVWRTASRTVGMATVAGHSRSVRVAQTTAQARRGTLVAYIGETARAFEAFRTAVPTVEVDRAYDVTDARAALEAADVALTEVTAEPVLSLRLSATLHLGAVYLDALEATIEAVELGQSGRDEVGFLSRYQQLANAYNTWAESARADVDALNENLYDATLGDSSAQRRRFGVEVVLGSWPSGLVSTCSAAIETWPSAASESHRAWRLADQVSTLLLGEQTGLEDDCRLAVEELVDTFAHCRAVALASSDGDTSIDLLTASVAQLQARAAAFLDERASACGDL